MEIRILDIQNQEIELTLEAEQAMHILLLHPASGKLHIHQKAHSRLLLHCVSVCPPANGAVEIIVEQEETGCSTRLYGLCLLREQQQLDLTTRVWHQVGGGQSDQLVKFVLDDQARGSFYGELKVQPDAQQTEAHQTNRNILLSRQAKIATKPQLEIYADDVKCSHGATTGQLDRNAIFYMQQRGLSESQAQHLLLSAFLEECLTDLPDSAADPIRQHIASAFS